MQILQTPSVDYAQEIATIVEAMPLERKVQVYEYALFLQSRSPIAEETQAQIEADEAWWDAQFTATSDEKLAELVAAVRAEIRNGNTMPMFDEYDRLIR